MPKHTFILNGKPVTVNVHNDVRLLWVLRDLLGVTGPKYGCGIRVCRACTSHINGKAFNPCSVPINKIKPTDRITTIEGLAAEHKHKPGHHHKHGEKLHPMQEAWLDMDVPQCGYCQPGQIMNAVALVHRAKKDKRKLTEREFETIRNICRCGTYTRIREAIEEAARHM